MSEKLIQKWNGTCSTPILPLTSEYIFKKIFSKQENESILKDFLEAILERNILKVVVLNPEIPKDLLDSKMGILDLKVKLESGELIDVELEMKSEFNIKERNKITGIKFISEKLNSEYDYIEKKKIITIYIFNFNYFQRNSYHSIAKMKFENTTNQAYVNLGYQQEDEVITDIIEMHFIELPKFMQINAVYNTKLEQWMWLLTGKSKEKLEEAMKQNKEIEKAVKALEEFGKNEEEKELYECRKKAEWEYIETIDYFTRKRMKEGLEKGEKKGKREQRLEIAKKMLQEKIEIEMIKRITELNQNEIEKLLNT